MAMRTAAGAARAQATSRGRRSASAPRMDRTRRAAPDRKRRTPTNRKLNVRHPLGVSARRALDHVEEGLLHAAGDRPGLTTTDDAEVDLAHRGDLRRGAAHEDLVGAPQLVAREGL